MPGIAYPELTLLKWLVNRVFARRGWHNDWDGILSEPIRKLLISYRADRPKP